MAVSVFFSALGLLIGPGIAGRVSVLGTAFAFGGNLGGARLILVARETGGLAVVDVLDTTPLVSFVVPFVVTLLNGFFNGAEIGRFKGLGEPLVNGCLVTKVDVRGVVLVLGVEADFVATGAFGVVGVLGDDTGVLVKEVRGVVGVVLADIGRDAGIVALGAGFGAAFITDVAFNVEVVVVVFGTVVGRTLEVGLEVDGAVVGLNKGFVVVADEVVFLRMGADAFGANGFVEVVLVLVVVVLALVTVGSNFFAADFLETKLAPATAAIAAVPTAAATAISATWNLK